MLYPDPSRFSNDFRNYLKEIAHLEHYPRNHKILTPGEMSNKSWFIKKGMAKIYYYVWVPDKKNKDIKVEKEVIICFLKEKDTLNCVDSFFGREPAQYYISPIEPCTLYAVTKENFDRCYTVFPEIGQVAREIILGYKQKSDLKVKILSLNAEERFAEFHQSFDTSRISTADLAAYLHVSRSHLARVRKKSSLSKNTPRS
ncbi:CRP-like cAMP-binding protein [Mucilaginibacter gracilis]|uniref:CRP-like cAMP-binding protein n=1 Tax=Mucilaginibacter gracilis TaxID=423350 RepID=A0A495J2I7_9SPHI|nr:Crp/Fnr family transcriptional regulator [Mucilaginibacter gracilis]RKR82871.1 CRP-like cAMP-binding protein [Mucilaginibacter gracilis]